MNNSTWNGVDVIMGWSDEEEENGTTLGGPPPFQMNFQGKRTIRLVINFFLSKI